MSVFRGSGVALVIPFHEDKSINFEYDGNGCRTGTFATGRVGRNA